MIKFSAPVTPHLAKDKGMGSNTFSGLNIWHRKSYFS